MVARRWLPGRGGAKSATSFKGADLSGQTPSWSISVNRAERPVRAVKTLWLGHLFNEFNGRHAPCGATIPNSAQCRGCVDQHRALAHQQLAHPVQH